VSVVSQMMLGTTMTNDYDVGDLLLRVRVNPFVSLTGGFLSRHLFVISINRYGQTQIAEYTFLDDNGEVFSVTWALSDVQLPLSSYEVVR
jgi:hypothetical protein